MAAEEDFNTVDQSGRVHTAVFFDEATNFSASHTDFDITIPDDWVLIGGGAIGSSDPGALLTASYPRNDGLAWVVSTRDHLVGDSHRVTGYAIGLKVDGLSPGELRTMVEYVAGTPSNSEHHPKAITDPLPTSHTLIGGGFKVEDGTKNLATRSYPAFGEIWRAESKDHHVGSPASLQAISIGLAFSHAEHPCARFERAVAVAETTTPESKPEITVPIDAGYALTGIGAEGLITEPGTNLFELEPGVLLWKLRPVKVAPNIGGVEAGAKDHVFDSPGRIRGWAIGIKLVGQL